MNHIQNYAMKISHSGPVKLGSTQVQQFRKEWQRTFNKPLSFKVAKDYLSYVFKSKKTMTRKGKRGGSSLSYAPLAYRMEPGGSLPHGSYPEYVSKGFFTPQSDNIANCGKPWISDSVVPAGLGSNVVGGGKRTRRKFKRGGGIMTNISNGLSAIAFKPYMSQNPPTTFQGVMSDSKGALPFPGGQTSETTYKYLSTPNYDPVSAAPERPYNPPTVFTSP
jgi:hypothetical protein